MPRPLAFLLLLVTACRSSAPSESTDGAWSTGFEPGEPFAFRMERTGDGALGHWSPAVEPGHPDNHVLAVSDNDATSYRFPLFVRQGFTVADGRLAVRFRALAGEVDQAGGLVVRHRDVGNYYVLRANALEDNVRFYRLVDGRREQLGGADVRVTSGEWHELALEARGETFRAFLDGQALFEVRDATFPGPGEVGLWVKADSLTWFDDLAWRP
jgi:hypothetical protein